MKQFFIIILAVSLISCNDNSTSTPTTDADRTKNNDTAPVASPDTVHLNGPVSSGSDTSGLRR